MIQVEQEKKYTILKNAAGQLMFLIRGRLKNAEKPTIVYNGKDHALFYRNPLNTIVLDFIHPEIQKYLSTTQEALVVETQGGAIIREYTAAIKIIKDIPIPSLTD